MAKTKSAAIVAATIPAGLLLAERILGVLKEVSESTPLWDASSVKTNEMMGPTGSFSQVVLHAEVPGEDERYTLFLAKHWAAVGATEKDPTYFFVARDAEPSCLEIRTFERLGYIDFVRAAATALNGMPVQLEEDRSWTWDMHVKTSAGQSLYKRAYLLRVKLVSGEVFNAKKWLASAMDDICASLDERAGRCPFQLAQEAGIEGMNCAEYTKTGFILESYETKTLKRIQTEVFSDCKTTLVEPKKHAMAKLTVEFA